MRKLYKKLSKYRKKDYLFIENTIVHENMTKIP